MRLWRKPAKSVLLDSILDPSPRVSSAAARMLGRRGTTSYRDVAAAANSEMATHRRGAWLVRCELGAWDRVRADLETMSDPDPAPAGLGVHEAGLIAFHAGLAR